MNVAAGHLNAFGWFPTQNAQSLNSGLVREPEEE